ncbi:MAG: hypothetical protein M3336_03365 [Chloroflexota bacterium]|nr:hypothetical protein [Chloroflexota bacterium]
MVPMDPWSSSVADMVARAWILAKEIGKGGGGSTEEPTVCIALLPLAVGLAWLGWRRLRQAILHAPGGRAAAAVPLEPERKVQTA